MESLKISSGLAGVAGEYAVAAELCRLGYLASITLRNAKGVDILATNESASKVAAIQVKTNQGYKKSWVLNVKAETYHKEHLFYVFVNLAIGSKDQRPEFHIVPSKVVADFVRKDHARWLSMPGMKGQKRNDTSMRKFSDENDKYLGRWNLLGL